MSALGEAAVAIDCKAVVAHDLPIGFRRKEYNYPPPRHRNEGEKEKKKKKKKKKKKRNKERTKEGKID